MKISLHEVTWYTKLLAVVLFVATFWAGFLIGKYYQSAYDAVQYTEQQKIYGIANKAINSGAYEATPEAKWRTFGSHCDNFTFDYPDDYRIAYRCEKGRPDLGSRVLIMRDDLKNLLLVVRSDKEWDESQTSVTEEIDSIKMTVPVEKVSLRGRSWYVYSTNTGSATAYYYLTNLNGISFKVVFLEYTPGSGLAGNGMNRVISSFDFNRLYDTNSVD